MDIRKEGWLHKKSKHVGFWRKRWIVLKSNTLSSYKKEKTYKNPTETIILSKIISIEQSTKSDLIFNISCNNNNKNENNSAISFKANNSIQKEIWLNKIKTILDNNKNTTNNTPITATTDCHRLNKQMSMILVSGYISRLEKLLKYTIIPKDIHILCFNFYFIKFDSIIFNDQECVQQFFDLLSTRLSSNGLNGMRLLLRATRSGANNDILQEILPNNSPYLYVVSTTDGNIFGGYSSIDISKSPADTAAFVYLFKGDASQKPCIYDIKTPQAAIYYGGGCGLMVYFGSSGAIVLFENPTKNQRNYCFHCRQYGLNQSLLNTMGEKHFVVDELEIFHVPN